MNERIAQMAEQAAQESALLKNHENLEVSVDDNVTYQVPATFIEAFANLIIKECAEQALKKGTQSPYTDFRTGSILINEYLLARYGVE